ncbi:hypothetical protein IWQ62_003183, partial [Dispira parvispora]
ETAESSQEPGTSSPRQDERTTAYASVVSSPSKPASDHPPPPTVPFATPGLRACKSVLTLLNVLAVIFVLDFVFVPYFFHEAHDVTFMRVGALYPDGAKILVRDPDAAKVKLWVAPLNIPHDVVRQTVYDQVLPSTLEESVDDDTISTRDSLVWQLWSETEPSVTPDFTYVLRLTHLEAHTHYVVRGVRHFANDTTQELNRVAFRTAPLPSASLKGETLPTGVKFTFASGSCIKPNFPYHPLSVSRLPGFRSMAQHSAEFLLFLGDFIYADVPYFFGPAVEDYRRLYRQVYSESDTLTLLERMPMIHMYDDHEVLNNWDRRSKFPTENALTAYEEYQGLANPDPPLLDTRRPFHVRYLSYVSKMYKRTVGTWLSRTKETAGQWWSSLVNTQPMDALAPIMDTFSSTNGTRTDPVAITEPTVEVEDDFDEEVSAEVVDNTEHSEALRPSFFTFEYGDVAFFVMDTRRYRSPDRDPDTVNKTMLGSVQKQYLHDWLTRVNHTHAFKMIASSVPLTRNWVLGDGDVDTWAGFLTERSEILRWVKNVPNVVFLSGDRHEVAVTRLGLPEDIQRYQIFRERFTSNVGDPDEDIPHDRTASTALTVYDEDSIDDRPIDFSTSPINQFYVPLINSYNATTDLDESIFYRRVGNIKYGLFHVDTASNPNQPTLTYQLFTEDFA